jgi:hypothetical protein
MLLSIVILIHHFCLVGDTVLLFSALEFGVLDESWCKGRVGAEVCCKLSGVISIVCNYIKIITEVPGSIPGHSLGFF